MSAIVGLKRDFELRLRTMLTHLSHQLSRFFKHGSILSDAEIEPPRILLHTEKSTSDLHNKGYVSGVCKVLVLFIPGRSPSIGSLFCTQQQHVLKLSQRPDNTSNMIKRPDIEQRGSSCCARGYLVDGETSRREEHAGMEEKTLCHHSSKTP